MTAFAAARNQAVLPPVTGGKQNKNREKKTCDQSGVEICRFLGGALATRPEGDGGPSRARIAGADWQRKKVPGLHRTEVSKTREAKPMSGGGLGDDSSRGPVPGSQETQSGFRQCHGWEHGKKKKEEERERPNTMAVLFASAAAAQGR